jgi:large subunit ribosomal protein L32
MHLYLKKPSFTKCPKCGKFTLPHMVCPNCGYYKDKEIIDVLKKLTKKERKKKEKEMKVKETEEKKERPLSWQELSKK